MFKVQPTQKWLHEKISRNLGPGGPVIAYPERNCFRLGPAQGIPRQSFREIWVEIGEIFKQNLGDSGAKLWSGATNKGPGRRVRACVSEISPGGAFHGQPPRPDPPPGRFWLGSLGLELAARGWVCCWPAANLRSAACKPRLLDSLSGKGGAIRSNY